MTLQEIAEFLMAARVIDDRILINEPTVATWNGLIPDWLTLDEALNALREHYQASDKRIMPANIINHARAHRPKQVYALPEVDCEDCNGTAWLVKEDPDGYRRSHYCTCAAGRQMREWHGR